MLGHGRSRPSNVAAIEHARSAWFDSQTQYSPIAPRAARRCPSESSGSGRSPRSPIETGRAEGDREVGAVEAETRSHGSAAAIVRGSARLVPAPARRPVEIVPEVAEDRPRPAGLEGAAVGRQPGRTLTGCLKWACIRWRSSGRRRRSRRSWWRTGEAGFRRKAIDAGQ